VLARLPDISLTAWPSRRKPDLAKGAAVAKMMPMIPMTRAAMSIIFAECVGI
jgi:hypothetical protein